MYYLKRLAIIMGIMFISSNLVYGFNYGHISQDTIWSDDVTITGDVWIDNDVTLTIKKGVTVKFLKIDQDQDGIGDLNFIVNGTLNCQGDSISKVIFCSFDNESNRDWGGIDFISSKNDINSILLNTEIQNAYEGLYIENSSVILEQCNINNCYNTGISITGDSLFSLKNSQIENCYETGILIFNSQESSQIEIKNSTISENGSFAVCITNAFLVMDNTTITENNSSGLSATNSQLKLSNINISKNMNGFDIENSTSEIFNCNINENENSGIVIKNSSSESLISNCSIISNKNYGVQIENANPKIEGCNIRLNKWCGINVSGESSNPTVQKCIITENDYSGLLFDGGSKGQYLYNTIKENNGFGVKIVENSLPTINNNNIFDNSGVEPEESPHIYIKHFASTDWNSSSNYNGLYKSSAYHPEELLAPPIKILTLTYNTYCGNFYNPNYVTMEYNYSSQIRLLDEVFIPWSYSRSLHSKKSYKLGSHIQTGEINRLLFNSSDIQIYVTGISSPHAWIIEYSYLCLTPSDEYAKQVSIFNYEDYVVDLTNNWWGQITGIDKLIFQSIPGTANYVPPRVEPINVPPTVENGIVTSNDSSSVTITGYINPNGLPTSFYIEYGLTELYGSKTNEISIGSGSTDKEVHQVIDHLELSTTYHYRIVATNDSGTVYSSDEIFQTMSKVMEPKFDKASYEYIPLLVTITCSTSGSEIHFTTDGTIPDKNSLLYTEPIYLTKKTTLKAIAYKEDMSESNITTAIYIDQNDVEIKPDWMPIQNQQFNMAVIGRINIEDTIHLNPESVLGAFIEDECHGIASPKSSYNGLIFLTISSNVQYGEMVSFKFWDADQKKQMNITDTIVFNNQEEIGTYDAPHIFYAGDDSELLINFGSGYTWFSVNIDSGDMDCNAIFSNITPVSNDRIIGQTSFAVYSGTEWVGTLKTVKPNKMYKMKLSNEQLWSKKGKPVPLEQLDLSPGYSWSGYLPQNQQQINGAFVITPEPLTNDRIIDQYSFAVFNDDDWIGSLDQMKPGKGYIYRLSNNSILQYLDNSKIARNISHTPKILRNRNQQNWNPVGNQQFNMSIISKLKIDEEFSLNENDLIGAFVGNECRGVAHPHSSLDGMLFLTVTSNVQSGEIIDFKAYINDENAIYPISESIEFQNQSEIGLLDSPFIFNISNLENNEFDVNRDSSFNLGDVIYLLQKFIDVNKQ